MPLGRIMPQMRGQPGCDLGAVGLVSILPLRRTIGQDGAAVEGKKFTTQILVGLTGNIGSGKSALAGLLEEQGAYRIDADALARDAVEPGSPGLQEVIETFGPDFMDAHGKLKRAMLGALVFSNPDKRKKLEDLLHPRIRTAALEECHQAFKKGFSVVLYEAALLLEGNHQDFVDKLVVIRSDSAQRQSRVMKRDQVDESVFHARTKTQMDPDTQATYADYVVVNDGTLEELRVQSARLMNQMMTWLEDKQV